MKDLGRVDHFSKSVVAIGKFSIDPVWFYADFQSLVFRPWLLITVVLL